MTLTDKQIVNDVAKTKAMIVQIKLTPPYLVPGLASLFMESVLRNQVTIMESQAKCLAMLEAKKSE